MISKFRPPRKTRRGNTKTKFSATEKLRKRTHIEFVGTKKLVRKTWRKKIRKPPTVNMTPVSWRVL